MVEHSEMKRATNISGKMVYSGASSRVHITSLTGCQPVLSEVMCTPEDSLEVKSEL